MTLFTHSSSEDKDDSQTSGPALLSPEGKGKVPGTPKHILLEQDAWFIFHLSPLSNS